MRALTASGAALGSGLIDALRDADSSIAAITSISPADACTVATALSMRYAIQCWDAPELGKAIFWKPSISLGGLYRADFSGRSDAEPDAVRRGLLRVTLAWDGRPLHVFCAQLAEVQAVADWQLAQVARELETVSGATLVALDSGEARVPQWPGLSDAWASALWRSILFPHDYNLWDAARAAFGVTADAGTATGSSIGVRASRLRILCSRHFAAVRASRGPAAMGPAGTAPLIVDLAPAAPDGDAWPSASFSDVSSDDAARRTGAYSAR